MALIDLLEEQTFRGTHQQISPFQRKCKKNYPELLYFTKKIPLKFAPNPVNSVNTYSIEMFANNGRH